MAPDILQQALDLLSVSPALTVSPDALERMQAHLALIRQWNGLTNLVSTGDVPFLVERHLVDSLSLAPHLVEACNSTSSLLDIGTGSGFPAIPLKCLFPDIPVLCVERSTRKMGFLQRVITLLELKNISLLHGEFPDMPAKVDARCVTARAVERPRQLLPRILQRLPRGSVFLCQSEPPNIQAQTMFHVEHVEDAWRQSGLRRGSLYTIKRV